VNVMQQIGPKAERDSVITIKIIRRVEPVNSLKGIWLKPIGLVQRSAATWRCAAFISTALEIIRDIIINISRPYLVRSS